MHSLFPAAFVLILWTVSCADAEPKYVDLSYVYKNGTLCYPKGTHVLHFITQSILAENKTDGNLTYWQEQNYFIIQEHCGTHLDAPRHFAVGQWGVSDIPLEKLIRPAVWIDVEDKVKTNRSYSVTTEDISAYEKEHGEIPKESVFLIRTGLESSWNTSHYDSYYGVEKITEDTYKDFSFPSLHVEAAKWLIKERQVVGVGIEGPSIDDNAIPPKTHVELAKSNVYILENVMNIHKLPRSGVTLYVMPMKIGKGSGAPTRVVAVIGNAAILKSVIASPAAMIFFYIIMYFLR